MVETNTPEYWNDLSEKGEVDSEISSQVKILKEKYFQQDSHAIFSNLTDNYSFSDDFSAHLNQDLKDIFSNFSNLTEKEIKEKSKKISEDIQSHLIIIHIKKIACKITFDAYSLLKLAKALDMIIDEVFFRITSKEIFIEFMDPSRICLTRISLSHPSYKYYQNLEFVLNIQDFKGMLKCEAQDKSNATFQMGEKSLFLTINSEKFGTPIHRTLHYLDEDTLEVPLENLVKIEYPHSFSIEKYKFAYTMKNLGIYDDIVDITANGHSVIFSEEGTNGRGEVPWDKDQLLKFSFDDELVKRELESEYNENSKEKLRTLLEKKRCLTSHSLIFLSWIDKLVQVLEKKDPIHISIRKDHPIRIATQFPQLGESSLLYFLAPKVTEEQYTEEDEVDEMDDF